MKDVPPEQFGTVDATCCASSFHVPRDLGVNRVGAQVEPDLNTYAPSGVFANSKHAYNAEKTTSEAVNRASSSNLDGSQSTCICSPLVIATRKLASELLSESTEVKALDMSGINIDDEKSSLPRTSIEATPAE